MKKIIILLLMLSVVSIKVKNLVFGVGSLPADTEVIINKGTNSGAVAKLLYNEKVIHNPLIFKIVARIRGLDKNLKAGEYSFKAQMSMFEVISKLAEGDVLYRKITLPEGRMSVQLLEQIEKNEFLSGEVSIEVKEGELLPETYSFVRGDSKNSIIIQAKKAMDKELDKAWQNRDDKIPLKSKNELLILASIVEKETGIDDERGLVASVFVNRLHKGMRLQTDPTVIYAITQGKYELNRSLTRKDLGFDSRYNTYKYYGLPPQPICNPGKEAIRAAANPEISDYLYFVANGSGGHNFAQSLNEHNNNVSHWKKIKKSQNK